LTNNIKKWAGLAQKNFFFIFQNIPIYIYYASCFVMVCGSDWFLTRVVPVARCGMGVIVPKVFAVAGNGFRFFKADFVTESEGSKVLCPGGGWVGLPDFSAEPLGVFLLNSVQASGRGFVFLRKDSGFVVGDLVFGVLLSGSADSDFLVAEKDAGDLK
jgi:hypothetical protein